MATKNLHTSEFTRQPIGKQGGEFKLKRCYDTLEYCQDVAGRTIYCDMERDDKVVKPHNATRSWTPKNISASRKTFILNGRRFGFGEIVRVYRQQIGQVTSEMRQ